MAQRPQRQVQRATQRAAYDYLTERARDQAVFSVDDLVLITGRTRKSEQTYLSKQYRDYVVREGNQLRVRPAFVRVSWDAFLQLVSQRRPVYQTYTRIRYDNVVTYEFFLPLTREDRLRRALDDLFYRDTVVQRLTEIGLTQIEAVVPRHGEWSDDEYVGAVCDVISQKFGGYSISHVSGRFRADNLKTRREAGDLLAEDKPYLMDETTGVVRFIIPCSTSMTRFGDTFEFVNRAAGGEQLSMSGQEDLMKEARQIRFLFFHLFAEAIARTVNGEEEIWLLESGPERHLYVWQRTSTLG